MADRSSGGRGWAMVGVVGVVVMIAVFAFGAGRLTAPADEPGAAAPEQTTSTIGEVAVGEPVSWEQAAEIGETWPVALVEHDGTLYLFGTSSFSFGPFSSESAGLDAWVSADGTTWESLGSVIADPAQVGTVVSTPRGMLALGESGPNGQPTVWMSSDGVGWSASELPTTEPAQPGSETFMQAAGANDAAFVVFGETYFNPEQALFDALPEEFKSDRYGIGFGGPPFSVTIHGPLGLALHTATAEELGLSEEQVAALTFGGPFEEPGLTLWRSADGRDWTTGEIEAGGVQQVWTSSDGALVATGWGFAGPQAWTSTDGTVWDLQPLTEELDIRGPWNDGLLASRYFGPTEELVYSTDIEEWTSLGVEEALPEGLSWNYHPIAAGGAGIALVAHGYDDAMHFEPGPPQPIVLEKDGYTLTADEMRGTLVLSVGDEEVVRLFLHSDRVPDEIEADLAGESITFIDPETGESLVTFSFDELDEASEDAFGGFDEPGRERQVFMFSADGSEWNAQDLTGVFGEDRDLSELMVSGDRIVAILITQPGGFRGPPEIPMVQAWTALLP